MLLRVSVVSALHWRENGTSCEFVAVSSMVFLCSLYILFLLIFSLFSAV